MGELVWFFGGAAGVALLLANLAVWSRRRIRIKVAALALAAAFLPLSYVSMTTLLGQPKPVQLEWLRSAEVEPRVLSSQMVEDVAIYLWVAHEGLDAPRSYVLPWSEETARELHEAQQQAEENGTEVRVNMTVVQEQQQGERAFFADPQKQLPPKTDNLARNLQSALPSGPGGSAEQSD